MRLRFAKGGTVPPGGVFFYADPANGVPLIQDHNNLGVLVPKVRAAYVAAGKPAPEPLVDVVEAFICEHVPRGFCVGHYSGTPVFSLTPQAVKEKSTMDAASYGRVDPGTTKARMAICGSCAANSKSLCMSCTGLTAFAVKLAGRTQIAMDDSLGICRHDRIMVSLLVSLKTPTASPDGRPGNRWRLDANK